jgi:hypothetical protein
MKPSAHSWLHRTCGTWRSERRYLFGPNAQPVNLTTYMEIRPGDRSNQFTIRWDGKTRGTMDIELDGNVLVRSRDYFGDGAHHSDVAMVDDDTIRFTTTYEGTTYTETIQLISHDQYRLRNTVGLDQDGKMVLVGSYWESRQPLPSNFYQ